MKTKILIALLALSTLCLGQGTGIVYNDFPNSGPIGTAAATIDQHTFISIYQTTPNIKLTIPNPTAVIQGKNITINNAGTATLLFEPGGYIAPGKSLILRWSGIWQVSGSGQMTLQDSLHKVYAIDTSGYGTYRRLEPADLPDSIPTGNVFGLDSILNEKISASDLDSCWPAAYSQDKHDSLAGALASKADTSDFHYAVDLITFADCFQINNLMINLWNTTASWGDHSQAGYILRDTADSLYQVKGEYLTTEIDPQFNSSVAAEIDAADTARWNAGPYELYSSYQAIINQTGTNDPVASRKDNNFSGTTFTWARTALGTYTLTASNPVFSSGNTVVIMSEEHGALQDYTASVTSDTVITFNTAVQSIVSLVLTVTGQDGLFTNTLVEVRVYN